MAVANQCMLAIEKRDDFVSSPPYGFRLDGSSGKIIQEGDAVTVMVKDKKISGRDVYFEVNNSSELNAARDLVFRKPILTTCHCSKPYTEQMGNHRSMYNDQESEVSHTTIEENYVMLINTIHPQVKVLFDEAFHKAEQLLQENRVFRIKIEFSESMKVFYMNNVHVPREVNSQTQAYNCDIFITHGVGDPTCADNFFACKNAPQTMLWCVCFPCCLLSGFPFLAYKKFVKGLTEAKVGQALPVTYHQGPFQLGFNLLNLLYPPGTMITTITTQYPPPPTMQPYA